MNEPRLPADAGTDIDPGLIQAAAAFLPGADGREAVPGHPHLLRVRHDGTWWKVRRWPEATPEARVELVHRVLEAASAPPALAPRVRPTPEGATFLVERGVIYDCLSWLDGAPVAGGPEANVREGRRGPLPAVVPDESLAGIVRALAEAHDRTEALAADQRSAGSVYRPLLAAVTQAWKDQRGVLRPLAPVTPAARRWLAIGERALPAAEAALAAAGDEASRTICHLDLWPAHVIMPAPGVENALPGLIGWERCNTGSPLVDLAQIVSRCRGWSAAGAELAIASYSEVRPLPPEDRRPDADLGLREPAGRRPAADRVAGSGADADRLT